MANYFGLRPLTYELFNGERRDCQFLDVSTSHRALPSVSCRLQELASCGSCLQELTDTFPLLQHLLAGAGVFSLSCRAAFLGDPGSC